MAKIKAGVIGMGFIGVSHIDALRRVSNADLAAVADMDAGLARAKAEEYGVPKAYASVEELLADPDIEVVHNCTPNHLHMEVNEKVINAGKHIFSEKPLAVSSEESARMIALLEQRPDTVHAVNFNYRMNPLAQEMKNRIAAGEIGKPMLVHGSYLQDWLLYETDYNWRVDADFSGPSRCIADIGSHWMDLAQAVTGSKIIAVCADLLTAFPVRKKPKGQVETFSINTNAEYEDRDISTEDYGAVLVRFENGARGVFYASEISAGRKCYLNIEIDGQKSSFYWNQETADQMWQGQRDGNNMQVMRNPNLMMEGAKPYTYLAAGHPEGWNDAMRNNVYAVYRFIGEGKKITKDAHDFADFYDGHYLVRLTEAILESSQAQRWVSL